METLAKVCAWDTHVVAVLLPCFVCCCCLCCCCCLQRGLSEELARQVAEQLTATDVLRAHARDELGIDLDELANPLQVRLGRQMGRGPRARVLMEVLSA
jgi:hypothetical protein